MPSLLALISFLLLLPALAGQGSPQKPESEPAATESPKLPVGWRSIKFKNPTSTGAKELGAVVHYPAKPDEKNERNAAFEPEAKKLPVIVVLHGFGATGGVMYKIGQHFVRHGYVAVLTNTTRTDRKQQAINARALFAALEAENADAKSIFAGKLDMSRAGITGHSMGGGNAVRVLGDNPGYKCGFCFAPWTTPSRGNANYVATYASKIDVPLAIVHGVKDRVLPWRKNAMDLYEAVAKDKAFKALWVLDKNATHVNVAIPAFFSRDKDATFELCAGIATAFFDRFLKDDGKALAAYLDAEKKPAGILELHVNAKPEKPQ